MSTEGIIAWGGEVVVKYGVSPSTTEEALIVKYSTAPSTPPTVVRYGVYAVFKSTFTCTLQVRRTSSLTSRLVIHPYNKMEGDVEVYGYGQRTFHGKIYVRIHEMFNAVLKVSPWNRMSGIADIQPIPRVEEVLYPIKDAFIRSGVIRMNYGKEQSMTFGTIDNSSYTQDKYEIFRSLIQFDLTHLPNNVEVEKAILRLYSVYELKENEIEVINNLNEWAETTVAWVNKPELGNNSVQYKTEENSYKIEIDVLPIVRKWTEDKEENHGFTFKLLDELDILTQSFYTREYTDPRYRPQLELRYYDKDLIVSFGRTPLRGSLIVNKAEDRNLRSKLTVKSRIGGAAISGEMIVVNPRMRNAQVTVSRPFIVGTVGVRRIDDKTGVYGTIIVPNHTFSELDSKLKVNRRFMQATITVKKREDLEAYLIVANKRDYIVPFTVNVSKPNLVGFVRVKKREDFNSTLIVQHVLTKDMESFLTISRGSLVGEIDVVAQRSLPASMTVTKARTSLFGGKLKLKERRSLQGRIEVVKSSSLTSIISVTSGNFYGNLTIEGQREEDIQSNLIVKKSSDSYLPAKLKVKEINDVESTLTVKHRSEFKGKLSYVPVSSVIGRISVISGNFYGSLAVPSNGYKELDVNMIVNVRMISEMLGNIEVENPRLLRAKITIRREVESYAFIM